MAVEKSIDLLFPLLLSYHHKTVYRNLCSNTSVDSIHSLLRDEEGSLKTGPSVNLHQTLLL